MASKQKTKHSQDDADGPQVAALVVGERLAHVGVDHLGRHELGAAHLRGGGGYSCDATLPQCSPATAARAWSPSRCGSGAPGAWRPGPGRTASRGTPSRVGRTGCSLRASPFSGRADGGGAPLTGLQVAVGDA